MHRSARHWTAVVCVAAVALGGCNLIFGVGEPTLVEQGGGGATASGTGGQGQGTGGEAPSCVGVVCDDGNICTGDFCDENGDCRSSPNDAAMPEQLPADCVTRVCSGGVLMLEPDDSDLPADDQNPCTSQTCSAGTPTFSFAVPGFGCNGSGTCNGAGLCSTCSSPSQCGVNTECAVYSCNGQCGVVYIAAGPTATQVEFDCNESQCTGDSAVPADVPRDDDIEDDGNDCTIDKCFAGAPIHTAHAGGQPCSTGVCNGEGLCAQCFDGAQCAGNPVGEACLANWKCGCKVTEDCRGKYGSACLATEQCGCSSDADCQSPGAAGRYCNLAQKKCSPPVIEGP